MKDDLIFIISWLAGLAIVIIIFVMILSVTSVKAQGTADPGPDDINIQGVASSVTQCAFSQSKEKPMPPGGRIEWRDVPVTIDDSTITCKYGVWQGIYNGNFHTCWVDKFCTSKLIIPKLIQPTMYAATN